MKKMFLLFSHKLTPTQKDYAIKALEIDEFVYLPENLQIIFSNIPSDLNNLDEYLLPIKDFLRENSHYGDVALIQGDFGAVYQMINFSKSIGLTTVYSTTNRLTEETYENGRTIKKSIFEHVMFREYL